MRIVAIEAMTDNWDEHTQDSVPRISDTARGRASGPLTIEFRSKDFDTPRAYTWQHCKMYVMFERVYEYRV